MPSSAYSRWIEFVGDPQDLLQRLQAALAAGESDPHALSRAVIVSLAAAWETYVEHVALEAGQWVLSPAHLAQFSAQDVQCFNNAKPANVRSLLTMVLGHDPWPHMAVSGKTVEQTKVTVGIHQQTRHQIAHGQARPQFSESALTERIAFFNELVTNADQHIESVLTATLGYNPW